MPELNSIYKVDNQFWIVVENKDIHNVRLKGIGFEGEWIACFDKNCSAFDTQDLIQRH